MILLINDDGIDAPGLRLLYHELRRVCKLPVLAVAPEQQRSGQAHAITLRRGLTVNHHHREGFFAFSIDGTPADCLKLALKVLCPSAPRIVVAGVNHGPNVGRSIFYSGTVGAALEAAIEGHPAVALSHDVDGNDRHEDLEGACRYAAEVVRACLGNDELVGRVLNVNLPLGRATDWKEMRIVPHGHDGFSESYASVRHAAGDATWQLVGTRHELDPDQDTDSHALLAGHPTATLLDPDFNRNDAIGPRLDRRLRGTGRR